MKDKDISLYQASDNISTKKQGCTTIEEWDEKRRQIFAEEKQEADRVSYTMQVSHANCYKSLIKRLIRKSLGRGGRGR